MSYYIWIEDDPKWNKHGNKQVRHTVLIRSVIRTRRKNIGQPDEYTNDDPEYSNIFLIPSEVSLNNDEDDYYDDCSISQ